jgi:cell division protein FtsL
MKLQQQPEIGDTQLSGEENKLIELERQKRTIETADHRGFGDAIRLIQLRGEIEALEENIRHDKQRAKDKRGG